MGEETIGRGWGVRMCVVWGEGVASVFCIVALHTSSEPAPSF